MVQLTREAPSDPDWPHAAFVNVVGPAQDKQSFLWAVVTYAAGLGYRVEAWEGDPEPVAARFPKFPRGVRDRHTKRAIKDAQTSGEMQSATWHSWEADEE